MSTTSEFKQNRLMLKSILIFDYELNFLFNFAYHTFILQVKISVINGKAVQGGKKFCNTVFEQLLYLHSTIIKTKESNSKQKLIYHRYRNGNYCCRYSPDIRRG